MSLEELATHYKTLYKFIQHERLMRNSVFAEGNPKRSAKLADADRAMQAATAIKDALKELLAVQQAAMPTQQALIEVPSIRSY